MSENRETIRTRVQRHVGTAIDSTVNDAIMRGFKRCQRKNHRFMEASDTINISEGDTTFSLPSDFKQEKNPEIANSSGDGYTRVNKIIKDGIEERSTSSEGRPLMYRIWEGTGQLLTEADQDYSFPMEYYRNFTDITDDDDLTGNDLLFLTEFAEAIEFFAISAGKTKQNKYAESSYWYKKFLMEIGEVQDDDLDIELANQDLQMEMPG